MARHPQAQWHPTPSGDGLEFSSLANPKVVLHTTETGDRLPGYDKGAPHFSLNPRTGELWQHIDTARAAYTLRSPGPPSSPNMNAGHVLQIELLGYAADSPGWGEGERQSIAELLAWCSVEHAVPARFTTAPFNGSGGYGTDAPQRLSWAEFVALSGGCGHQHAPAPNTHWDPGAIDVGALEVAWREALDGDNGEPAPAGGMYPLHYGDNSGDVQYVAQLLAMRGHDLEVTTEYGDEMAAAVLAEFPAAQPEGKRVTGKQGAFLLSRLFERK